MLAHCVDDLPLHFICFAQKKNTALTCGRNTSTKQKTHFGGPKRTEEENLRRSGIDGKMMRLTGSLSLPKIWSDAWVRYLDHNAQNDISHKAAQEQRSKYTIYYLRSVDEDRQAPPLSARPGYQEAKTALVEMQRQSRQHLGITFIPKSERRRLNDQLNPSLQVYFAWLSTDWAEYFAEEREPPTLSSSSQWSSTSWWSPHSWSSNWQGWHQHSWQDDKWSEQR